jgi:hypothetical protein
VPADQVDCLYFGGSNTWRHYYEIKARRVVRRSDGRHASAEDPWFQRVLLRR